MPSEMEKDQITPFEDVPLSVNAIPDSEIDKAALLRLEIIEGPGLGSYYEINAWGLVGIQGRGRNDGWVLVGSQEYANNIDEPFNDIVLESVDNSEIGKRHFLIKYNIETTSYYLRDLGDGNGTFVRLDQPLILKTGYIISFGDSHMFIQISEDHSEGISKLDIKFLDGPKTDQSYSFSKFQYIRLLDIKQSLIVFIIFDIAESLEHEESKATKTLKIGRMNDWDIKFTNKGLSRIQCIIEFINQWWVLKDGDSGKNSTNGTWLFADELYPIHDNMVFKAGRILFKSAFI